MPAAYNVHQPRLLSSAVQLRIRNRPRVYMEGSRRRFGEPSSRQGAALFNQGFDFLGEGVARKKQELAAVDKQKTQPVRVGFRVLVVG